MSRSVGVVTWAALLARWTEFAKSAVALPTEGEGGRWRRAVPDVIALQALVHALGEVDSLADQGERPMAIDLAEVQVGKHAESLHALWNAEELPPQLRELIDDARAALRGARSAGSEWSVDAEVLLCEHPAQLVEALLASGFAGDLYLPTPGVPLFQDCPAAFARGPGGSPVDESHASMIARFLGEVTEPQRIPFLRQVYRQFDFAKGRAVRDLVVHEFDPLPGGQPLLVLAIDRGRMCPVTLPVRGASNQTPLPLVFSHEENAS